jgi:hypothetical protein
MSERKWERFREVAVKKFAYRKGVRVSINPGGEITFDVETYRRMGEPQAVFLNWESATRTIGLEPANVNEASSVLVRARHARTNRVVRSTAFLKKHGVLPETTLIVTDAHLEDKVLVLDTRTTVALASNWKKIEKRESRRAAAAEVRADREKHREELRAEKERLKAERAQLSEDRARLRAEEARLKREARERERAARKYEQALMVEAENLAKRERDHLSLGSG